MSESGTPKFGGDAQTMLSKRAARTMLKDFYSETHGSQKKNETGKNERAQVEKRNPESDKLNLDSEKFEWKRYIAGVLAEKNTAEVLSQVNSFNKDIQKLESEMKTIVYENYGKFIGATDTLGKMRKSAQDMGKRMEYIKSRMEEISRKSKHIESELRPGKEELLGLEKEQKFVSEVQMVMDLPEKLHASVAEGNYKAAAELWARTQPLLSRYGKVGKEGIIKVEKLVDQVERELWRRWRDEGSTVEEAVDCSKLLIQISTGGASTMYKEYIENQYNRMKKKSPREGKAYLKDWNTVIEGFLNQFSPPKSSGLLGDEDEQIGGRHELEAGDQEEKVDSRMVSGWQIMTREAVVDAQHRFPTFCEELEQLYDEKKLEKRLWQEGEGEESRSLVVLNEVITEMQEYPILLKYGGLKGKIGRTVRNQYESMMSRRLVKVLDTLMLYFDNVMYKAKGSAAGNSTYGSQKQERKQEKADGELEEGSEWGLRLMYNMVLGKEDEKIDAKQVVRELEKELIHNIQLEFIPIVGIIMRFYENNGQGNYQKIAIQMLNGMLDKFFREWVPQSIYKALNINSVHINSAEIGEKQKDKANGVNKSSEVKSSNHHKVVGTGKMSKTNAQCYSNPANLLILARFLMKLEARIIKNVYLICQQSIKSKDIVNSNNGSSGHSMELFATLNIYPKKTGDVQGRNEQKAELDVLKYDEDSLTVLYRKCVDEILMVFVKTVGNEMANFYYYYSIEAEILRLQSLDAGSSLGLAADTSKNLFKLRTYFHVLEYLVLTVFGESNSHQQSNREGLVGRTSSVINEYETRVHEAQQRELLLIGNKSEMVKSPPVSTSGAIALKSPGFYQLRNSSQQTQSPNNMIPVSRTLSNMNVGTKMMYNRSPTITTETGLSQASYSSPIMAANAMMMEKSRSFLYNERLKSITGSTKSITTSISNLNSAAAAAASVGGVGGSSNPGNARNEDASLLLILNNIDKLFTERHEIYPKTVVYSVKINPTVNIEQQMEQQLGVLILVHIINIMLKGVLELVLAYGIGLLCHDGAVVDLLRANLVTELKSWIMEIYYNGNGITNSTNSAGGTIDSNVNSPSINANNLNKSQQRNYTGVKQDQYLKSSSTDFSLLVNIINEIEIILTSRL